MTEVVPYQKHNPPKMKGTLLWITLVVSIFHVAYTDDEIYQPNCREALGMFTGLIEDEAITASSSYDLSSVGPQNARIRTEKAGGAWCPKSQIAHNVHEYLQVDLGKIKVISLVETQGRFGNGQGQEYAQEYKLEYQRNESSPWVVFHDKFSKDKFQGNSNTYIAELREVRPPIIARKIRFVPYSRHPRTVCMRVEVYGCPYSDGMTSYSMRQGDTRGSDLLLYDFRYDGEVKDGQLTGGLGQLTDLEEGTSHFRLDRDGTGKKGYEWVGWKNDSIHPGPVQIVFNFDAVRNFSFVIIHCNNMFSKGVRVFRTAKLYFSAGGEHFQAEPVTFNYMKDSLIEYARAVIIPIPHRIAKVIKMELYFAARWILISEVKFESEIVNGPVTFEETPPPTTPTTTQLLTTTESTTQTPATTTSTTEPKIDSTTPATFTYSPKVNGDQVKVVPSNAKSNKDNKSVNEDKKKKKPQGTLTPDSAIVPKGAIIHPEPHDDGGMQEEHIGIIIGTLAALILLLFAIAVFIIIRNKRRKQQESAYGTCEKQNMNNKNMDDLGKMVEVNGMLASYQMYADDTYENDTIQRLKMKEALLNEEPPASPAKLSSRKGSSCTFRGLPSPNQSQKTMNSLSPSPIKHSGDQTPRSPSTGGHPSPQYPPPPIPPPPHLSDLLKAVDFIPIREDTDKSANRSRNLVEFPRRNLVFVEKLGTGEFGDVHRCEAYLGNDQHRSKSLPVAVKVLRQNVDPVTRENFLREAEILAGLKDPNIAIVIGVSTQAEPMFMILEYSRHGDLHQFLRQRKAQNEAPPDDDAVLSYGCQLYLSMQMASGMKYLESLNMVHRDLATRNCLVTHNYIVKISDLGSSSVAYDNDYFRIEGRARLPIRWMSWESVILGKFSSKSDVWSFAVTLWEILTLARERPLSSMNDQQVISNCSHFFNNDPAQVYLPQPYLCPREIYDLMCECWNRDETMRPSFREIHMFLQRKNMGYAPSEDIYMKPWA